jgi:hypothetical protein
LPSTCCCAPWAAWRACRATGWKNWAFPQTQRTVPTNEYLQTTLPQHLRRRRRGRALPVHPHRRAPGLVRGGQRAVRRLQEVQGRLLGDPLGTFIDPEVARVGLNEQEARERASPTRSRATASTTWTAPLPTAKPTAFVKVLTVPGKDRSWASPSSARMRATCWPSTCWP